MLKTILVVAVLALVVVIVGILILAATKPDTFVVKRSAQMSASPDVIASLINDLHNHRLWSPFEMKDPEMKRIHRGAEQGVGAIYEWDGNKEIGQGSMEITESTPSKIAMKLDFVRPFEAHNNVTFTLEPQGNATNVTWAMRGPVPYLFKIVHMFCNIDRMVGAEFETGLRNIKNIAEKK